MKYKFIKIEDDISCYNIRELTEGKYCVNYIIYRCKNGKWNYIYWQDINKNIGEYKNQKLCGTIIKDNKYGLFNTDLKIFVEVPIEYDKEEEFSLKNKEGIFNSISEAKDNIVNSLKEVLLKNINLFIKEGFYGSKEEKELLENQKKELEGIPKDNYLLHLVEKDEEDDHYVIIKKDTREIIEEFYPYDEEMAKEYFKEWNPTRTFEDWLKERLNKGYN